MKNIEPRTLKGFRDFLPGAAQMRLAAIEKIRSVFQRFGFLPLETPTLEYADVLTGKYGNEGEKLLYRFRDQGNRNVAMRYDLTVPLARVVAQYPDIPKPFRRYQIAPVWRADNPQKGRYREFWQCDADIAGSASVLADADIILVAAAVLRALGITTFQVQVNNRKLLNSVLRAARIEDNNVSAVLRTIDKWEKIGRTGVFDELGSFLTKEQLETLRVFLPADSQPLKENGWNEAVAPLLDDEGAQGLRELRDVLGLCSKNTDIQDVRGVLNLARGLDYYTGTIFEIVLTEKPEFGSIIGGGRYDQLIGRFTGTDMPAVGMSVGLDRLLVAMDELGIEQGSQPTAQVFVALLDNDLREDVLGLVNELRSVGIATAVSYDATKLEKQLKYADTVGIPFVVLYGKKEQEAGTVVLKDLRKREQRKVERSKIVEEMRRR